MTEDAQKPSTAPAPCSCVQDPFAALPIELWSRPIGGAKTGLRKVTCPGCGLAYWTNRQTELCVDCEKKGVKVPESSPTTEG